MRAGAAPAGRARLVPAAPRDGAPPAWPDGSRGARAGGPRMPRRRAPPDTMGAPNALVPVVLALYVPAVFLCVRGLGPRRGVLAALLGGWLLLPCIDGRIDLPLVDTKIAFVTVTTLAASAALDLQRWLRLRPQPLDLAAALVALGPFATALSNGLGAAEGLSAAAQAVTVFAGPYLLGRAYLGTPRGAAELARWVVGGALLYVPLCLWEIRMSPQLHRTLYGYHPFDYFGFAVRWGGYRPNVFLSFGLMLGTFMATGALLAWWLWRTRTVTRLFGIPMGWAVAALVLTTVAAKATGAIILMLVGMAALEAARTRHGRAAVLVLCLTPPAFCAARIAGWDADEIVEAAALVSADRAQSVAFRASHEQRLLDRAMERPWLGWGRWGRSRIHDEAGADVSVTDSLWIISLGTTGIAGLGALLALLVLPAALLLARFPARRWSRPSLAPVSGLAVATVLWAADGLLNSMPNPLFPAMAGATVTFAGGRWRSLGVAWRRRRAAAGSPAAGPGGAGPLPTGAGLP